MTSFNAILTLARIHDGEGLADEVHGGDLDAFAAVTGTDNHGHAQIIITLSADTLDQAAIIARRLLARFTDAIRLDVMTTSEFDQLHTDADNPPLPDMLSVTEAAAKLSITRQAVLARIRRGSLQAHSIGGGQWAIPATELP